MRPFITICRLYLTQAYSQSSNANQWTKFNVKQRYCPWFKVYALSACRLEIVEAMRQKLKFLLVSSSFIHTSLKRSDQWNWGLPRDVWCMWLMMVGWSLPWTRTEGFYQKPLIRTKLAKVSVKSILIFEPRFVIFRLPPSNIEQRRYLKPQWAIYQE